MVTGTLTKRSVSVKLNVQGGPIKTAPLQRFVYNTIEIIQILTALKLSTYI